MIRDTIYWITIHDVATDLGIELDDKAAWAIGARCEASWTNQTGTPPVKDNRRKKKGGGSHCFAHYPPTFRERIENHIASFRAQPDPQLRLDLE